MNISTYSPMEYLMIDLATTFGNDKGTFDEAIEWVKENSKNLDKLVHEADEPALYMKSLMALRNAAKTGYTNHRIELDACASGLQMFAALTGCVQTASQVGMVDPDKRCDVYTALMGYMNKYLPEEKHIGYSPEGLQRQDLKTPFMTHYYQSTKQPEQVFGKGTAQLVAFYKACSQMCPGGEDALASLAGCVQEGITEYATTMPDGHYTNTKVITQVSKKITIDEIPTASGKPSSMSHVYDVVQWDDGFRALGSKGAHITDAYGVREMRRRAKHNKDELLLVDSALQGCKLTDPTEPVSIALAQRVLEGEDITDNQGALLAKIIDGVLDKPSFELVTIHDAFTALPQYGNEVRWYYREILAEIAESNLFQRMLRDFSRTNGTYTKMEGHEELPSLIRQSNYCLR